MRKESHGANDDMNNRSTERIDSLKMLPLLRTGQDTHGYDVHKVATVSCCMYSRTEIRIRVRFRIATTHRHARGLMRHNARRCKRMMRGKACTVQYANSTTTATAFRFLPEFAVLRDSFSWAGLFVLRASRV